MEGPAPPVLGLSTAQSSSINCRKRAFILANQATVNRPIRWRRPLNARRLQKTDGPEPERTSPAGRRSGES
ncbi:hypothetical protein GCM10028799_79320 [Kribbella italica]